MLRAFARGLYEGKPKPGFGGVIPVALSKHLKQERLLVGYPVGEELPGPGREDGGADDVAEQDLSPDAPECPPEVAWVPAQAVDPSRDEVVVRAPVGLDVEGEAGEHPGEALPNPNPNRNPDPNPNCNPNCNRIPDSNPNRNPPSPQS